MDANLNMVQMKEGKWKEVAVETPFEKVTLWAQTAFFYLLSRC